MSQQHQGAKAKQGQPPRHQRRQPHAASRANSSRVLSENNAKPFSSAGRPRPGKTSSPASLPAQQEQQLEAVSPTAHQIKMMVNYVCKAEGQRMCMSSLKECMASNQGLKALVKDFLSELLEELLPFALDSNSGGDPVVKAVTKLDICDSYATEKACLLGDMCPKLHICRSFVFGQECEGKECPFGHDLKTQHNLPLMKDHYLDILGADYVKRLLLENYIRQNFGVCKKHSTKEGCNLNRKCQALHICKYFLQNRCKSKGRCPRSHDLQGPQPQYLMARHGLGNEKYQNLVIQEQKDVYAFKQGDGGRAGDDDRSVCTETSTTSAKPVEKNRQPSENAEPLTVHQVKQMLKHMCKANDGKTTVANLKTTMSYDRTFSFFNDQRLGDILRDLPPFALEAGVQEHGSVMVKAVTKLEICEFFSREKTCLLGHMCPKLHVCKLHALAQKCANKVCPFGHDLRNEHNLPLLNKHCLDVLTDDQVRQMLLQNYIRLNLRPCIKHSTKEDCQFKDQCRFLHVCKYFIQNRCTARDRCPRAHDLMVSQPRHLLAKHGIDVENHHNLVLQELKDGAVFRVDTEVADDRSVDTETGKASTKPVQPQKAKKNQPAGEPTQSTVNKSRSKRTRAKSKKSKSEGLLPTPTTTLGLQEAMHVILFEVCEAGGSISMDDLLATATTKNTDLGILVQSSAANMERIVLKWPNLFRVEKQAKGTTVTAFTSLTICSKSGLKAGCQEECGKLHLCRNFLTNTCNFGKMNKATGKIENPCRYGHQVRSPHNLKALARHNLHKARAKHVKLLLRENNHLKGKPMICRFYNSMKGCRFGSSAATNSTCKAMHVCYHHIKGHCNRGAGLCPRTHFVLEPQPKAVLMRHGINVRRPVDQIIQELREMMAEDEKPESVLGDQDQDDLSDEEDEDDNLMTFSDDELIHFSTESDTSSDESEVDESLISFDVPVAPPSLVPLIPLPDDRLPTRPVDVQFPADDIPSSLTCQPITKPDANSNLLNDEAAPEICLYHLRGQCGYKDSCKNEHCPTAYQWQEMMGRRWSNFSAMDNEEIEVNYCDPCKTECFIGDPMICPKKIDFQHMTLSEAGQDQSTRRVRRLSTPSTVEKPAHYKGTTTWQWYWERYPNRWVEFGEEKPDSAGKAEISSTDIEEKYVQNPFGGHLFTVDEDRYLLDFKKMVRKNLDTNAQESVRRRPSFNLSEKSEKKTDLMSGLREQLQILQEKMLALEKKSTTEDACLTGAAAADTSLPHHWVMDAPMQAGGFQLIPLTQSGKGSQEYKQVAKLFAHTLGKKTMQCVKRVQNLELWEAFQRKKASMQKKLPEGATVCERHLFHGTSLKYVDPICQQGFDWRVCGLSVGTKYGKGSYFARDAKFSDCYTGNSSPRLFLVRVLVGEYTLGNKDMVRPPPKDPKNPLVDLYDSCVNQMEDPSIFVIFNQDQAYPEWLIEY